MTSYAVHRISTLTTPRHLIVELGGNGGSSAGFSRSTSTAVHDDRISEVIILLLLCFIKETCFCSYRFFPVLRYRHVGAINVVALNFR